MRGYGRADKNLVSSYTARDDEKLKTIDLQIAAHEAKLGHGSIAQELKSEAANIGKTPWLSEYLI